MTDSQSTEQNPKLDALRADLGPEAEGFWRTIQRLEAWRAPRPTRTDTARLLDRLQPALQPKPQALRSLPWVAALLQSQFRLIREEIWFASALIVAIGLFVTLATTNAQSTVETLPFVFIAPIITAVGIALLYGPEVDPAIEIELASPTAQRVILLARLTLVFSFDLALSVIASIILTTLNTNLSLSALIATWLAPMAFLSALAFLLSVWFFNSTASMLACLLLWAMQVLKSNTYFELLPVINLFPSLLAQSSRPWLIGLAMGMGAVALWVAGNSEKWSEPAA